MRPAILLLASDPLTRRVLRRTLDTQDYCIMTAEDLDSAEELLRNFNPDLLIVRPYIQNVSGHEAAAYLRRIRPGIPVLIVGGLLDDEQLESREILQHFEIFPKPYTPAELLRKVKEVLAKRTIPSPPPDARSDRRTIGR